jgi:Xaa-Pro aminopeptidase
VDHQLRRTALAHALDDLGADALLVTRLPNVRYLTGFTGSNGQAILSRDRSVFLTDGRYIEQSRHEVPDCERRIYLAGLDDPVAETCVDLGVRVLGFEDHAVSVKQHGSLAECLEGTELVGAGDAVERLRWVKDDEELDALGNAQAATDRAFEDILDRIAVGMSERSLALDLEQTLRRHGADALAFDPIVAFGECAAEPHHEPGNRMLEEGDIIKMDFGALWGGYHADMTRTIAFGQPPAQLAKIHDIVREAQQAGVDAVRAGVAGGEVDRASRAVIDDAGYGEYFSHGLGHGVGLEIHEGPRLAREGEDVLPVGAVVTVEPGVYVPGLGGVRIEDMVEIREDGCRVIGTSIRELVEL